MSGQINDDYRSLVGLYLYAAFLLHAQYRRHVGQVDGHVSLLSRVHLVPEADDSVRGPETVRRARPRPIGTV